MSATLLIPAGLLVTSRLSPRLVARSGTALVIAGGGVVMAAGMVPGAFSTRVDDRGSGRAVRRTRRRRLRPAHDTSAAAGGRPAGAGVVIVAALLAVVLLPRRHATEGAVDGQAEHEYASA